MNLDLDFIKIFRDTFDWGIEYGKSFIRFHDKNKLNKIINSMSDLIANKKTYLYNIQSAIKSQDEHRIDLTIKQSLEIAESDTQNLLSVIKEVGLKDSEIYKILKTKVETLANIKLSEIERLKKITDTEFKSTDGFTELLSDFENRWNEISNQLENIKKAADIAK